MKFRGLRGIVRMILVWAGWSMGREFSNLHLTYNVKVLRTLQSKYCDVFDILLTLHHLEEKQTTTIHKVIHVFRKE